MVFRHLRAMVVMMALICGALPASAAGEDAASVLAAMASDADRKADAIKSGASTATFCANCHGQSGVSNIAEVPNLAAQHPAYLLRQFEAFATGQRKNEFMEGLIKVLSPQERAELVMYYTTRKSPEPVQGDAALIAEGRKAFGQYCQECHGSDGHGNQTVPRLAGQQDEYLRLSLTRYLTMSGERIYPPMTAQVTKLGADRIDAVVAYLRTLQ